MHHLQQMDQPNEFVRLIRLSYTPDTSAATGAAHQLGRAVVRHLHSLDDDAVDGFIAFVLHLRRNPTIIKHWADAQPILNAIL